MNGADAAQKVDAFRPSAAFLPCVGSLFATAVIVAPRLGAVAAALHGAPAPLAGAAVVEEQPAAFGVGAAPHTIEARTGQKIAGRPQHGRQQRQRRSRLHIDIPAIGAALALGAPCGWAPPPAPRSARQGRAGPASCAAPRRRTGGAGSRASSIARSNSRRTGGLPSRGPPLAAVQPGEILRRLERLGRLGLAAPEARIDELQAEIGAIHHQDLITG